MLPGEKTAKKKKSLQVSLEQMRIDPSKIFANGQLKSLSIQEMCRQATKEDKEDLDEKVTELREEMRDEKVRSNGNQTQAATSTRHPTRFALMTKKDNVKVARKKQKQAI